ncbi:aminodeoxychorismate lyase [Chitinimonas lacunae]|uniref:aminodeoxychorismate lyase n=1 Tax=Chitinimonas lacunae TaxID=1963018 RepID=A0ABV8MPX9_9NEIS
MAGSVVVNGELAGSLSAQDRGFTFGDSVFRTLRCEAGRLWFWSRHYAKLAADCARLGLNCPAEATLLADLALLVPTNAAIRITISRGVAARGYACDPTAPVTRVLGLAPLPSYPAHWFSTGAPLRHCDWRWSRQPGLAGLKHGNRLDQVMARREWHDPTLFDGLMRNIDGELVSGVMSNLWLRCGDRLLTPPLVGEGVAGVTRAWVFDWATQQGYAAVEKPLRPEALAQADEVILCNSLAGIVPVAGDGVFIWHNFSLAHRLRQAWLEEAARESIICPTS